MRPAHRGPARFRLPVEVRRASGRLLRRATTYTTGEPADVLAALARALRADQARCWYRLVSDSPGAARGVFAVEAGIAAPGTFEPFVQWARSAQLQVTRPRVPVPTHADAVMQPRTFLKQLRRVDRHGRTWRQARPWRALSGPNGGGDSYIVG